MNIRATALGRARRRCARAFRIEELEGRSLPSTAAETFAGPSLTSLIRAAREGEDTAPQGIHQMLAAFQSQLESGPLADLKAGTVDGAGFVAEVQDLESSFEQSVDLQLSPAFPNIDRMLKLQGQRIVADVTSLNQQASVGLISGSDLATQAQAAFESLTKGPLRSLGTPLSAYVDRTNGFESDLKTLVQSLGSSASPALTLAQVNTTLKAEAEAYRADVDAALSVTHPIVATFVDAAVSTLEQQADAIAQAGGSDAQAQLTAAITAFDTAVLGTKGVFGANGPFSRLFR